jgi:hypothetical protein
MTRSGAGSDTKFTEKVKERSPEEGAETLRTNPDEVVDIRQEDVVAAAARSRTTTIDAGVDTAWFRRKLGSEDPGEGICQALGSHHGSTVTEGVDQIQVQLRVNNDGEENGLARVDADGTEVPGQVHLETDDLLAWILRSGISNCLGNIVHSGKPDFPGGTTIPLLRYPFIDALTVKGTVRNNSMADTILFRNRTEWSDGNREGEELPVKWAEKTAMGQFLLHVRTNIVDTVDSRGMITRSTGGLWRPDDANVPTIHNTLDDREEVPVITKILRPDNRMEVGGDGHADTVLISLSRLNHLENELHTLIDEVVTRAERPLTTSTRRRTRRTRVIAGGSDGVQDKWVDDGAVTEGNELIGKMKVTKVCRGSRTGVQGVVQTVTN